MSTLNFRKSAESSDARPVPQTVQLTHLTSIRFFAALHIFIFHLYEVHRFSKGQEDGEDGIALPIFDAVPSPLLNWVRHGYFSTSLFFLISGFILSYLYILPDGRMSQDKQTFWVARLSRVYPLHILVILLAAPIAIGVVAFTDAGNMFDLVVSGLLCATLLQAWFPPYALSWNAPTWALSAVAFYYLAFPWLVTVMRFLSHGQKFIALAVLPVVSLVPTYIFLAVFPDGGEPMSFWHEFVMRTPLLWIPHFFMGMLLARLYGINRFDLSWQDKTPRRVSWGDAAFATWLVLAVTDLPIPNFVLRHGLLAPLYLVMIYDLVQGRGLLAKLLMLPGLPRLGDASFSIFVLQLPVGMIVLALATAVQIPSVVSVPMVVMVVIGISLLSTNYFEKPFSRWLRARPRWQRKGSSE